MSAAAVLKDAASAGVALSLNGDNIAFKATTRPHADLIARLREHKAEIVALLRQETSVEPPPISMTTTLNAASIEEARKSVDRLLDQMAHENDRRREWWRKPVEEGRLTLRSALTGEVKVIELPKGRIRR